MLNQSLTVIIVSYNSFATLRNCLDDWLANPSCRIVVVDNASSDGSAAQIRARYPAVEVLALPINLGYGRAANRALRTVDTPYALLLNPDIMARKSDAVTLVERMASLGDEVAVLAPAVRERDHTRSGLLKREWVIGAAMLFNMHTLARVGLFDDNIFLFAEETDLCHRIAAQRLAIYLDSDIYINHLSKQSSTPNAAVERMKNWHFGWSRMYVNDKHGLASGHRRPSRVLLPYALKSLFTESRERRTRYRARFAGALAYCRGEPAFRSDGWPQLAPARGATVADNNYNTAIDRRMDASNSRMNVLMVTNEFPPSIGGVQTHVHELARALVQLGCQVHVLTRQRDSAQARQLLDGIQVHRIHLAGSHLIYDWQLRRQLRRLIRQFAIDIIHVHGMRPLRACADLGPAVVFTNHTSGFLRRAQQGEQRLAEMRRQLDTAAIVLAPSEELAQRSRDTGYTGPVRFIANGVDTDRFCPGDSDLRARLGIPSDAFVAVLARRLVQKNGVLDLAHALPLIELADFHLLVAGDGAERAEFEQLVAQSGCAARVHMLGAMANSGMPAIYRTADVAVLPSLMEATSITGLEAMACGLPLIGTRVGGIPAIIEHEVSGLLVPPSAPAEMAAAITALGRQRERARAMGQQSLARAVHDFAWRQIAGQTLAVYREVEGQQIAEVQGTGERSA